MCESKKRILQFVITIMFFECVYRRVKEFQNCKITSELLHYMCIKLMLIVGVERSRVGNVKEAGYSNLYPVKIKVISFLYDCIYCFIV